jgi:hypothetical protein
MAPLIGAESISKQDFQQLKNSTPIEREEWPG